jgi:hypothetical protein
MIAVAAALGVTAVLGFAATWLALRHVRPAWLVLRCAIGRWASFTVEMDGRIPRQRDSPPDERSHQPTADQLLSPRESRRPR